MHFWALVIFFGRWFHVTWPNSSFKCRLSLKVLVQMSTLPKTWRIFHVEFLRQKLRNVSIAFHWLSISTPPQKLRTKQRTNSHRNYVTFQSPFIGCKCWLLVKLHAKKHEQTLPKITSRFNCLSLVANVNSSLNVTRKTTYKLSQKLRHVSIFA